jgi:DNA-binding IclR family transcriptional regulator
MKHRLPRRPADRVARLEGEFSLTVSRALQVLLAFSSDRPELGITELSTELSLSKPSVQRLVHALQRHEFLDQNPQTRKYRIGVQAFRVGSIFASARRLERDAQAVLQRLAADTGYSSYLSVLRHDSMVITACAEGRGPIKFSVPVGERLPLHCSATGKAALARLDEGTVDELLGRTGMPARTSRTLTDSKALKKDLRQVRLRGYAANWEENTPGVGSVAAAICDPQDKLVAVLSVGFAISQADLRSLPKLGAKVAATADEIARRFLGTPVRDAA